MLEVLENDVAKAYLHILQNNLARVSYVFWCFAMFLAIFEVQDHENRDLNDFLIWIQLVKTKFCENNDFLKNVIFLFILQCKARSCVCRRRLKTSTFSNLIDF